MIPLNNLLIITPDVKKEEKTDGGIIVLKNDSPVDTGAIKTLPSELQSKELEAIKVGDRVMYPAGSGFKAKDNGEDVLIMHYSKLIAIL